MGVRMLRLPDFDSPGVELYECYVKFNDEPDKVYLTSGVEVVEPELSRVKPLFKPGVRT